MPPHGGTRRHITYACGSRGVIVFSRSHRRESAFTAHLLQCEQSHRLVTLGLASLCDRRRCLVGWQLAWLAVMIHSDGHVVGGGLVKFS
ncbi:uncharacterized protein B0T23DRAFT_400837 [Neurospora hispaniola]|uniref:Uncharacterized protein n=1 Tax=Neurospora hispaniola TaxID=588809 RepID=A0AAJ0MV05_9PEZI|nr:hypothetical protein B0T23DRAFT_400837 [Neurospora hispaniola]